MYSKVTAEIDSWICPVYNFNDIKRTRPFPSPKIVGTFSFGKEDAKRRVQLPQVMNFKNLKILAISQFLIYKNTPLLDHK
jgi:hypothetical protein